MQVEDNKDHSLGQERTVEATKGMEKLLQMMGLILKVLCLEIWPPR